MPTPLSYKVPAVMAPRLVSFGSPSRLDPQAPIPEQIEQLKHLTEALLDQGRLQAAIGTLQRAVALEPEQAEIHCRLAELYRRAALTGRAQQEDALARTLEERAGATAEPVPVVSERRMAEYQPDDPGRDAADLAKLLDPPLTAGEQVALNAAAQSLLDRLNHLCVDLASSPNGISEETAAVRDHLTRAVRKSRQAVTVGRSHQEQERIVQEGIA